MKFFKPLFVLLVHPISLFFISVLLLLFNWLIFENKYEGWLATDLRTYRGLYCANDRNFISNIDRTEVDSIIEITLKPSDKKIKLNLKYGIHEYQLENQPDSLGNVFLKIGLTSLDQYSKVGNTEHTSSPVNLLYCNVPVVRDLPFSTEQWTTPIDFFEKSDVETVKKILKNEVMLSEKDNTTEKVLKIAKFLSFKLHNSVGIQPDNDNTLELYKRACKGESKLWCTGFAEIFHLFATVSGVKTRKVGFQGRMNTVYLAAHALCETYIPERNEWAFVDLITSNILPYSKRDNHYIGAVELYNRLKFNASENINTLTFNAQENVLDTIVFDKNNLKFEQLMFLNDEGSVVFRLPVTNDNYYSLIGKVKRYLGLIDVRITYLDSTAQKNNYKHYLKLVLLFLNVIFGSWFVIKVFKMIFSKKSKI